MESGFYSTGISDADALSLLIRTVFERGALFSGHALVWRQDDARISPFESPKSLDFEEVACDQPTLMKMLNEGNTRVLQVDVQNATGLVRARNEIITYSRIPPEVMGTDSHPVAIWTEGGAFDPYLSKGAMKKVGDRAYRVFRELVPLLSPAYASITIEWGLECPAELRQGHGSQAFQDFYASKDVLGHQVMAKLELLFKHGYIEKLHHGKYFSSWEFFNPEGVSIHESARGDASAKAGRIIGSSILVQ